MFLGGLYRLIHSILTILLEVGTVTASVLEIGNWVWDRQTARSVIAGIRVQTGQEHSEFMCIYTTPPWDRKLGEVREHLSAVLDPLQVQGYICEYPLPKIIIWAQYARPHDEDPFSLCDWLVQGSITALCEFTLRKHSLVWSLWCPKLLIENSSVGLGLSSPLSLIVPRISQKPRRVHYSVCFLQELNANK